MKKLLLLLLVLLIAFAVYNHQRLYVDDYLATVTRDGVKDSNTQVLINYSNDVILVHEPSPRTLTLIQHGQPIGELHHLSCLHFVGCMTDADRPVLLNIDPRTHVESMTSKLVTLRDHQGLATVITLF